jgi:uncharacterized protein
VIKILLLSSISLISLTLIASTEAPAEESLVIASRDARLAATLQLPADVAALFPAVVIVHGSGRVTARELQSMPGRRLAELGFAVLAYDKRGVGGSTGEYTSIGPGNSVRMFDLLAADAIAAVEVLRARTDIDTRRIGLVGISQGGWIAPLAASRHRGIAFVVTISGPAVSVGEEIEYSRLAGEDPGSIQGLADDEIARRMRDFKGPHGYDPIMTLESMTVPSLWILGERDRSIPLKQTVATLERIARSQRRPIRIHVMPGLNHGLRNTETGEQPDFWRVVDHWLRQQGVLNRPVGGVGG